jgi:uncharacterized membrane protein YccC
MRSTPSIQEQIKQYRQFASSYYVNEGFRITAAILVPVLILSYFGFISMGVAMGLGALCVSLVDIPGPLHHRKNAMIVTIIGVFFGALLTSWLIPYPWLLGAWLGFCGFFCSIIGVNGTRITNIGVAWLFVIVLHTEDADSQQLAWKQAALVAAGGTFYFLLSLALHQLRPFKLAQQTVGDSILGIADYLRNKANLYDQAVDFDAVFKSLLDEQSQLHHKQELVRELLFKTRSIVKDTTPIGRTLLMMFTESVDLFERIMTSQRDYTLLHQTFGKTIIFQDFHGVILQLASELETIGLAVQAGKHSQPDPQTSKQLFELDQKFERFRSGSLTESNLGAFISLKHILESLHDLHQRILQLHRYTRFDKRSSPVKEASSLDYAQFVNPSRFNRNLVWSNLSIHSNAFRHAIRVSVGLILAFLISRFTHIGHGYWITLTVLVILKPAYSLTRQRNRERLLGTIIGAVVAGFILYVVKAGWVLVSIMTIMMIGTYSLLRLKYFLAVVFMTVYLLIAFYLLKEADFQSIIKDRVLDTLLGSVLALAVTYLIPPRWEHQQIGAVVQQSLKANAAYYKYIAEAFTGMQFDVPTYKLLRKQSYVAMANVGDSFQRLLHEPGHQQLSPTWYQLVVNNHLFTSHVATLASYVEKYSKSVSSPDFIPAIQSTHFYLLAARKALAEGSHSAAPEQLPSHPNFMWRQKLKELFQKRAKELEAGALESETRAALSSYSTIVDQFEYLYKISIELYRNARVV